MPLGNKVRPTSAGGKLETQNITSILLELGPAAGNVGQSRAKTSGPEIRAERAPTGGGTTHQQDDPEACRQRPEWLERELLKHDHRRHSIALGDGVALSERPPRSADPSRSLCKLRIDQKVSLQNLEKLKQAFEEFERGGVRVLDMSNFRQIVKKCLGLHDINDEQIQELFMKIDYAGNGTIVWDEFCTYMQLEYMEIEESVSRSKQAALALPACIRSMCHGEPVLGIRATPDSTIVTVREEGAVYYWSSELQLKKSKTVFQQRPVNRKLKWATDFVVMPQYNKLIIATGEREIQFYELSSLEPYCQLSALETVPLRLDYCSTGPDECMILYGDAQGCVNIILITSVGDMLRLWKKLPMVENMPTIGIDGAALSPNVTQICWKIHGDWVTQVKYSESMRAIISTSNHEPSALVIGCTRPTTNIEQTLREIREFCREGKTRKTQAGLGTPQQRPVGDQTVFSIYKGVKTFDVCKKQNLLVTGGMDRLIRMWNPYVPGKPIGFLTGHCSPIFYLSISPEDGRIFSVSMDNIIKIWDIQDQACLFTAHPKASLVHGDLSACFYSPSIKALYVATDCMALLPLRTRAQPRGHLIVSHREPVLCCGYSESFRQVVSCTEGSVVKVWDFDTGSQVFEFGGAHGVSAITCLTFDPKGRRLVTGGRDGSLKVWNFNNGQCLKIFQKESESTEVCDCTYLTVNRNMYIISVGWNRRIDIYFDSPEDPHHIQSPQPSWQDDLKYGHKEDILCVAQCPPSLLASGSYDGEIIVWNLVSGHLQCRFLTPLPADCSHSEDVDRSASSLVFLRNRALNVDFISAACLVSSGAEGYVHFWNVLNGGKFLASFEASRLKYQVTKLAVTREEDCLYAADQAGFIFVYDIKTYALGPEQEAPKMLNYWRAHISSVTCLQIVEDGHVLLTSSTDCTVRLWTVHGEFIGTFGQSESWSIHTPTSWKHPTIPYEILIDPLSMPAHSILEEEVSVSDVINSEQAEETRDPNDVKYDSSSKPRQPSLQITDTDIEEEIKSLSYPLKKGKWLRHEIFKNANKLPNHGGPKAYHTLKCFDIDDTSTICKKPDLSLAVIDPFLSSFADEGSAES